MGNQQHLNRGRIKCLVWDLDNTLWDGVLLEGDPVRLRKKALSIIHTLDTRGILQSVASRNHFTDAMEKIKAFGLQDYFLYPQIHWDSKVISIRSIAESINIGLDAIAFVDDQPFERDEVRFSLPEVLCIDAANLDQIDTMPEMNPRFITADSKIRRRMILADMHRNKIESDFTGPREEFLSSLDMVLKIFPAREEDLKRAEELTVRTHQLNATGVTYTYDELNKFRQSNRHKLLMARLCDKHGTYGHIGLALVACDSEFWTIKLLLMSCRVMSRGLGSVMLTHIMHCARNSDVRLRAELVPTDRNRIMDITYRFAGFNEVDEIDGRLVFENDLTDVKSFPDYIKVER